MHFAFHNGIISVVAIFIKTAHCIQAIQQGSISQFPINTGNTHTVQVGALAQHIFQIDGCTLLNGQCSDICVILNRQVSQIVQVLCGQAGDCRQVGDFNLAAACKGNTGNTRAISIELGQTGASGQTNRFLQVRHVLQVQMFQQSVITNSEVGHVRILIAAHTGTNFQLGQLNTVAEVNIARIKARDITNALNDRSVIDINFSIVHCGDGAFNRVGLSALATHLHRVGAVQNRDIGISVGCDMECAIRFHASPVGGSITTNGHIITGCNRTGILRCHVFFLITLELPTLMTLVAMHHRQIACGIDGGIFVGAEVFAPHIYDPKLFGFHILIVLELFQNTSCTPCQRILTVAEHRCYLIGE